MIKFIVFTVLFNFNLFLFGTAYYICRYLFSYISYITPTKSYLLKQTVLTLLLEANFMLKWLIYYPKN